MTSRYIRLFVFLLIALSVVTLTGCSDSLLGEVVITGSIDEAGNPGEERTTFSRGETVYLSVELRSAYKGLESDVTWENEHRMIGTETISAARSAAPWDPLLIAFKLVTQTDWSTGPYTCALFIPDQGTKTYTFTLE